MDLLKSFKVLLHQRNVGIDNNVFKLHYNFTVVMLMLFAVLLTSKQYFGEPIDCFSDSSDLKQLIDNFCWINGTYIIKEHLGSNDIPGVGPEAGKQQIWLKYYQWVSLVFCIQALMFYIPHYIWKSWENSRLKCLVEGFEGPLLTPTWTEDNKKRLIDYIIDAKYDHNVYCIRYSFCEALNFLNAVFQIFFLDWLVTGNFTLYGISLAFTSTHNVMDEIFPKQTKCHFMMFGPSGTLENFDVLCILSMNILNEKIFLVLWFWLIFLVIASLLAVIYRAVVIFVPKVRYFLLRAQIRHLKRKQANLVVNKLSFGDFFVLYRIGRNVNPLVFAELVEGIYEGFLRRSAFGIGFEKLASDNVNI